MITHVPEHKHYLVQCDRCSYNIHITTATVERRVIEIAKRWGWALGTEHGDLCTRCAGLWRAGVFDPEDEHWLQSGLVCAKCGEDLPLTATVNKEGVYVCNRCDRRRE